VGDGQLWNAMIELGGPSGVFRITLATERVELAGLVPITS
jgi:hypothetical protein